jgi:hypothetical protein
MPQRSLEHVIFFHELEPKTRASKTAKIHHRKVNHPDASSVTLRAGEFEQTYAGYIGNSHVFFVFP